MSDGKKRISKAPPPINPLKGGASFAPTRNVPPTPNWEEEWNHTPEVRLWQACALSLNIEPHSMKSTDTSWMAPGGGPTFTDGSFPSNGVKKKFELRLRVLIQNIESQHFSPYIVTGQHAAYHNVRLDEFAAWVSGVVQWNELPSELVELAKTPKAQAEGINLTHAETIPKKNVTDTQPNWMMLIQIEAARRWKSLRISGANPTRHSLKDDLAKWCRENDVKTTLGIHPSGDYIYRHVLRNWSPPP